MKKKGIILGIAVIIIAGIFVWQSGMLLSDEQKAEQKMAQQIKQLEQTKFATLPEITLDEAEKRIEKGDDIVIYFGWVETCGDALNFQVNSFDNYLADEEIFNKIVVVNLDKEAPDALKDHELRRPIAKRFQIDQWTKDESVNPMELKSPQLVHYQNGKVIDLVSWTPLNSDAELGIMKEKSDKFFASLTK